MMSVDELERRRMRSENVGGDPLAVVTMLLEDDVITTSDRMTLLPTGNESVGGGGGGGEEFILESYLGPRYHSVVASGILIAVYALIFLTGIVGNASTCLVIIRNKRMHTATNYYLFSLAVSDVLTLLLGLPPELYTILEAYPWRFGEPYCLFKTFLTEMTSSASILTIASFTIERYLAICHSLRAQTMSGLSRAIRNIVIVWIVACITAVPYPIHTRTYYFINQSIPDSLVCNISPEWTGNMRFAFQVSTFLLFVLPMALIVTLYVQIGVALRRSEATRRCSYRAGRSPSTAHSRKSVFKMLVAVVVAFFICWAPFHAQRLMTIYVLEDQWTDTWLRVQSILFYVTGILYYVSCTVNPILYSLMSLNYRQAFKMTLCCFCVGDSVRMQRLRYAGTVLYSERSATGECTMHHHWTPHDADGKDPPPSRNRTRRACSGSTAAAATAAPVTTDRLPSPTAGGGSDEAPERTTKRGEETADEGLFNGAIGDIIRFKRI